MREKTFIKIMAVIAILGVLSTGLLIAYTIRLRQSCSIITYIANEM